MVTTREREDDPIRAGLGLLPAFRTPEPGSPEPAEPGSSPTAELPETTGPEPGDLAGGVRPADRPILRLGRPDRPTPGSTPEPVRRPTAAQAAQLVGGLLGLAVAGAAWLISARTGSRLRRPTKAQSDDIAAPLGRMLLRHVDLSLWGPDLVDAIEAGSAAGAYLSDGPLLQGPDLDPGLPGDLNTEAS